MGPRRTLTFSAAASAPSASPTLSSSAGLQLFASVAAGGKHVAGIEALRPSDNRRRLRTEMTLAEKASLLSGANFWNTKSVARLALNARFWPLHDTDAFGHAGGAVLYEPGSADDLGSGCVITTPSDLVRWGDHIRTAALVSAETFDAAIADAVEINAVASYGPGIIVVKNGSLDHGGHGEGLYTAFSVSPDRRTSIAVSCNNGNFAAGVEAALREVWGLPESSGL